MAFVPGQQRDTYAADVYLDAATLALNQRDTESYKTNIAKVFDGVHRNAHPSDICMKRFWEAAQHAEAEGMMPNTKNHIDDCVQLFPYSTWIETQE